MPETTEPAPRPACCTGPPGDCLANPHDPDAMVCGIAGCAACLHGCPRPDDCCRTPTQPAGPAAVPPWPPEITAVLNALHVIAENASGFVAELAYMRAQMAAGRLQLNTVTAKYDAALRRLHALQVLADNWDGRAAERTTDTAATLRACARELRAALDDGQPMPYTPGAFTNTRRFALEAARNGNIRRAEPIGWHDPLGHRYNDVARWLIQHGLAAAAGDVLAPTEAGIAALDGTT